jgi:N-acetylglucosamine kinase-like BadF-type ATPase
MTYVMGVDGGGSKTHAVITDAKGNVLGEGRSSGCNHQTIGIDSAIRNLKAAMDTALSAAQLTYEDMAFVHYALAGADREADFRILREAIDRELPSIRNWEITSDAMAGLRSGTLDNTGVVLINGSGTNAVGRSKDGRYVQIGGFGYLYGDWAGGSQISIETFRYAIRSWEEREIPSILTRKVPEFLGFNSMEQMLDDYLDQQADSVPRELTIVLHEAAEEGDELSIRLLKQVGRELGLAANAVIKRMGHFGIEHALPIVLVGSVFQKGRSAWLLSELQQTVQSVHPHTTFVIPQMEPVYGAVLLAMDGAGLTPGGDIADNFNQYSKGAGRIHE